MSRVGIMILLYMEAEAIMLYRHFHQMSSGRDTHTDALYSRRDTHHTDALYSRDFS